MDLLERQILKRAMTALSLLASIDDADQREPHAVTRNPEQKGAIDGTKRTAAIAAKEAK